MTDPRLEILSNRADAAALMLAAADDRDAIHAVISRMTYEDAARMLVAAIEVGGTMIRISDRAPSPARVREVLAACLETYRQESERLAEENP